jgi:two-component system chemotaxis sensor kinase CheA
VRERALSEKTTAAEPTADRETVLLVATHDGGRMAIPLSQVARLEEFPRSVLERVGSQDVVQYRDEILPLFDVSRLLRTRGGRGSRQAGGKQGQREPRPPEVDNGDTVQVVVHACKSQRVGLVVGQILDIVEETIATRSRAHRPGVLFTAVVQGRVTEFLDVEGVIRSADPHFFDAPASGVGPASRAGPAGTPPRHAAPAEKVEV